MISIYGPDQCGQFAKIANALFDELSLSGNASVELELFDKEQIAELNKNYLNKSGPTDVLSFPMLNEIKPFDKANYPLDIDDNGNVFLGSIIICPDVASENADKYGHSLSRELSYLFVHGLLHLLGYDHQTQKDKEIMRDKEEKILKRIGEIR